MVLAVFMIIVEVRLIRISCTYALLRLSRARRRTELLFSLRLMLSFSKRLILMRGGGACAIRRGMCRLSRVVFRGRRILVL
jgi:hypothetical protein